MRCLSSLFVFSAFVLGGCVEPNPTATGPAQTFTEAEKAQCEESIKGSLLNPLAADITLKQAGAQLDATVIFLTPEGAPDIQHEFTCERDRNGEISIRLLAG